MRCRALQILDLASLLFAGTSFGWKNGKEHWPQKAHNSQIPQPTGLSSSRICVYLRNLRLKISGFSFDAPSSLNRILPKTTDYHVQIVLTVGATIGKFNLITCLATIRISDLGTIGTLHRKRSAGSLPLRPKLPTGHLSKDLELAVDLSHSCGSRLRSCWLDSRC